MFKGVKDSDLLRQHSFTVVRFPNGDSYLIDPTFAQFMHPTEFPAGYLEHPEGYTAQTIRATPRGATFARDLARDGFIPLTEENARIYTRAMGVSEGEVEEMSARLMKGDNAIIREDIGGGFASNPSPVGNVPNQTPDDMLKELRQNIAKLEQNGDPQRLLPMARDLERRLDEVVQRGHTVPRQITEEHN